MSNMNYLFLLLFLVSSFNTLAQGKQKKKDRFPSYFGIVASPVIPNNFIGNVHTEIKDETGRMTTDFHNKWSYTFGATIRIGLTKNFSLETGISQVRRHFTTHVSIPDSNIFVTQKLAFINYDLPLNGLFYVKLSEKWYMDASLGLSITTFPSDVQDTALLDKHSVIVQGRRTSSIYFAVNAGLGFEYRTEKAGTFFLGFGAKVPLKQPLFGVTRVRTVGSGNDYFSYAPIPAGYFTIDFKYFIPKLKLKKKDATKPNPSLIE